ncbi:MAG: glutathione S-transferase domain-containing protein [Cyanobacteria bacterium J06627_32]
MFLQLLSEEPGSDSYQYGLLKGKQILSFLSQLMPQKGLYFAGDQLTIAEITAGSILFRLEDAGGLSLADYPRLADWSARLQGRPSWQAIALSSEEWQRVNRIMRVLPMLWERRRRRKSVAES